ncbi:D-hexose-6-phosphate mutarotase [Microbulbifer sp. YPW16]|uniref:D-hexose-6-phosphate mutarotase n=1 Tax=Microbulbifer sp. YPW16 TaxID=2904242 RepID=UPI001E2F9BA9|nr:D-hexose-6-phosphate mutarotase [Microbulbifer sp. YPW16]UHQ56521.1 D-hexose-6-phosphate mutarotase [Microbulbifer sp. YPW16]
MSEQVQTGNVTYTDSGALYGKPGLELVVVETNLCRAVVALQGAQLLEFQAKGHEPLLWLSPAAVFEPGKAVRGGIPLCLPWFGVHPDPARPKHGLARTRSWELDAVRELPGGIRELVFTYCHPGDEDFTPFNCRVTLQLGKKLRLALDLENSADEPARFSWAWHTYFPVDNVHDIRVHGLEDTGYLDNTRGLQPARQEGAVRFPGEVDRVYEHAGDTQRIETRAPIQAHSGDCCSVITWNPGAELAATLADVGEHYAGFVCVEHGNAFADSWQLGPGERRTAWLELERE